MDEILIGKISKDIISYENKDNYSLGKVFDIVMNKYNINDIYKDKIMVKVISSISRYGYDIISTHPLIFRKYK